MNRKIDLDDLLANASQGGYFSDGSAERVWAKAMAARKKDRPAFLRAIPAVAVCLALVCVFAVPQTRDAVFFFLGSVSGYLHVAGPEKSADTAAPVLTNEGVPVTLAVSDVLSGGEWANSLKVGIENVRYDGLYLTVKFSVSGEKVEHFMDHDSSMGAGPGKEIDFLDASTGQEKLKVESNTMPQHNRNSDGAYEIETTYDAEALQSLSGTVQVQANIECLNMDYDNSGGSVGYPVAQINLEFPLNVTNGNAALHKTAVGGSHALSGTLLVTKEVHDMVGNKDIYTNISVPLEGCSFDVDSIITNTEETIIKLHLKMSKGLDAQTIESIVTNLAISAVANGVECGGLDSTSQSEGNDNPGKCDLVIKTRALPAGTTVTISTSLNYDKEINGTPLVLGKPYTINIVNGSFGFGANQGTNKIPGGTFDITLPK